jgi:hypothetical protein
LKTLLVILLSLLFFSCGNYEKATGGKKDVSNPEIVNVFPEEFSDISKYNFWEITFSKPMNKNSMLTGIYIYPPVINKVFKWDKNTLRIEIKEELIENSNYYLSLGTQIRCERQNPLEKHHVFVYANGKLKEASISGEVQYERKEDIGEEVTITIAAQDSIFMFRKIVTGTSYKIDNLDEKENIITAFMDKNNNKRYDFSKEPYFRFTTTGQKISVQPINLVYADTTKPKIQRIQVATNQNITVSLSKKIKSIENIRIHSDSSQVSVMANVLKDEKLMLVTTEQDSFQYKLTLFNVLDFKENQADSLSIKFNGITKKDTLAPVLLLSNPKNGESIFTDRPTIEFEFTELIPKERVKAYLYANESQTKIELQLEESDNKRFSFVPQKRLSNYTTYKLFIQAVSWQGIEFNNNGDIQFIVIVR